MNLVVLLGNLTRDPELRYTPSQTAVTTLGLAVNTRIKQGDEWKVETCFVDVTVFGRQAETCSEYLSKGRQVLVEGRLTYRRWENKDGQTRSKHEVLANRVQFLGQGPGRAEAPAGGDSDALGSDIGDDAPF